MHARLRNVAVLLSWTTVVLGIGAVGGILMDPLVGHPQYLWGSAALKASVVIASLLVSPIVARRSTRAAGGASLASAVLCLFMAARLYNPLVVAVAAASAITGILLHFS